MIHVHVRHMIRRDMPEVLNIEGLVFDFPWSEEDFLRCLQERNVIGMVAEYDESVVGFMIYELHSARIHVLNVAVDPDHHRRGVGRDMMEKLINKLSPMRRTRIALEVRERNVSAQLFFRYMNFRATSVLRDFYEDTTEDAYVMEYRLPHKSDFVPTNRIARLYR